MHLLHCLFSLVLIEIIYAQSIPYLPKNGVGNSNIIAATQAQNAIANAQNLGIARSTNGMITNMPVAAGNTVANVIANTQLANAINENAAIVAANQDVANAITNANLANIANANLANGVANANLAALANANLASINGNMATFNLGNAFTITSGSPGNQGFGIQVLADALEVGGTVAVNGQIPIFGTVALNGHLPTDGSATVSYSCGRPVIE